MLREGPKSGITDPERKAETAAETRGNRPLGGRAPEARVPSRRSHGLPKE